MSASKEPRLAFRHLDDEDWIEVKAQLHGDKRVSIWEKYLEWTPRFLSLYAKYDPHMVTELHGHMSDHIVFLWTPDTPGPPLAWSQHSKIAAHLDQLKLD